MTNDVYVCVIFEIEYAIISCICSLTLEFSIVKVFGFVFISLVLYNQSLNFEMDI